MYILKKLNLNSKESSSPQPVSVNESLNIRRLFGQLLSKFRTNQPGNTTNYIAKSANNGQIKIIDMKTRKCLIKLKGHGRNCQVTSLILNTNQNHLISSSSQGDIKIWDIAKGVCIKTMQAHSNPVKCLVLVPNMGQLVSKDSNGEMIVWNAKTWQCVKKFEKRN